MKKFNMPLFISVILLSIFGLIMIKVTHNAVFDFVIAVIVSILIILKGISIFKTAQENLLDSALEKNQVEKIKKIIEKFLLKH